MEKFIQKISKEAGKKLLKYFKEDNTLTGLRGTSKEIVTKYDKLIDKFLIKEIKKKYPEHNILTEETGYIKGKSEFLWIIDSLDGSGNFANNNPLFSICIALLLNNEIILSVINAPAINEFYFAKKNKGAFLNKKRIKVSKIDNLKNSYLIYCEGSEKNKKRIANIFKEVYPKATELRKIGSAGIEIGWTAAGRADGYFTTKIDPWDVAAGVLLIQEAGGRVSDFKGKDWEIKRSDLVFSNGIIHKKFKGILSEF